MAKKKKKVQETICMICSQIIKGSSFNVRSHLFTHNIIPSRFECDKCSRTFYRYDIYKNHISNCAKYEYCICDYCNKKFNNKSSIHRHIKAAHGPNIKAYPKRSFLCVACKKNYCERRLLLHHVWKEHFNTSSNTEPTYLRKSINECWVEKMQDTFVQIKKLNHNVLVIKKCDIKPETFENKKAMTRNVSSNVCLNYSIVICDYCKKEMLKKSLVKHIREMHLKIRHHHCDNCKKSYARHYLLIKHKCKQTKLITASI